VVFTLLMNRHESERGRCDSSARLLLCHRVRLGATGRPPGTYLANPSHPLYEWLTTHPELATVHFRAV
jgi:hypothetical protein